MNLTDITSTQWLASDDYEVGKTFHNLEIIKIIKEEIPVQGKREKTPKAVAYFKGATKGWVINKGEARKIAKAVGSAEKIDTEWIGTIITLKVVGDVRRPDGTKGNAFRVDQITPKATAPKEESK
jgi:hypothetical protein